MSIFIVVWYRSKVKWEIMRETSLRRERYLRIYFTLNYRVIYIFSIEDNDKDNLLVWMQCRYASMEDTFTFGIINCAVWYLRWGLPGISTCLYIDWYTLEYPSSYQLARNRETLRHNNFFVARMRWICEIVPEAIRKSDFVYQFVRMFEKKGKWERISGR